MLTGKSSDKLFELIEGHIKKSCDRVAHVGVAKPIVSLVSGAEDYENMKQEVVHEMFKAHNTFGDEFVEVQRKLEEYADGVMDIRETLKQKCQKTAS
eukprot:UN16935